MRKTTIIFFIFIPALLCAQDKLSKLISPTSPAAGVLGLQPKTILAPKSYQALETSLYSNFFNEDGSALFPNDFALEFTPYWTKNHGLSVEEYLYPSNFWEQVERNSSFSLASTPDFPLGNNTSSPGLGLGYRTTFYFPSGKDVEEVRAYIDEIHTSQSVLTRIIGHALEIANSPDEPGKHEFLERIRPIVVSTILEKSDLRDESAEILDEIFSEASLMPELTVENQDVFIDSLVRIIDRSLNAETIFQHFKSYIRNRQGFSLDFAMATSINFPENNFENAYAPLQSFWLTPSYRFSSNDNSLKLMGVLRYEIYNDGFYRMYFPEATVYENNLDYGFALAGEFKKFSFQFEAVGRSSNSEIPAGTDPDGNNLFRKVQRSDFQYIGSFSYHISDQFVLTYNLGDRFEPLHDPLNTLVSLLTLNVGFGAPTEEDLDLEQ